MLRRILSVLAGAVLLGAVGLLAGLAVGKVWVDRILEDCPHCLPLVEYTLTILVGTLAGVAAGGTAGAVVAGATRPVRLAALVVGVPVACGLVVAAGFDVEETLDQAPLALACAFGGWVVASAAGLAARRLT